MRPSDDASDAEAVRECIRRSQKYEDQDEEETERLRTERDQLKERVDEHNELAKFVSEEEKRREAGLVQRVKWAVVGGGPEAD